MPYKDPAAKAAWQRRRYRTPHGQALNRENCSNYYYDKRKPRRALQRPRQETGTQPTHRSRPQPALPLAEAQLVMAEGDGLVGRRETLA